MESFSENCRGDERQIYQDAWVAIGWREHENETLRKQASNVAATSPTKVSIPEWILQVLILLKLKQFSNCRKRKYFYAIWRQKCPVPFHDMSKRRRGSNKIGQQRWGLFKVGCLDAQISVLDRDVQWCLNAPGAQHFSILATHSWINVTMMLDEFACCPHQVAERNGLHVYAIASFNLIHLMMPRSQFPQVQMHIGTNRGRGRLSVSTIISVRNGQSVSLDWHRLFC